MATVVLEHYQGERNVTIIKILQWSHFQKSKVALYFAVASKKISVRTTTKNQIKTTTKTASFIKMKAPQTFPSLFTVDQLFSEGNCSKFKGK